MTKHYVFIPDGTVKIPVPRCERCNRIVATNKGNAIRLHIVRIDSIGKTHYLCRDCYEAEKSKDDDSR
jgi:hypothetical protein